MDDVHLAVRVDPGPVLDLLVLFLEVRCVCGPVAATVGFRGDADAGVVGFVGWEFLEPGLGEVPEGAGPVEGAKLCVIRDLGGVGAY